MFRVMLSDMEALLSLTKLKNLRLFECLQQPPPVDGTHYLHGCVPLLSRLVNLEVLHVSCLVVDLEALHALQPLTSLAELAVESIDPELPRHARMLPASLQWLHVSSVFNGLFQKPVNVVRALRVIPPSTLLFDDVYDAYPMLVCLEVDDAADEEAQVRCLSRLG